MKMETYTIKNQVWTGDVIPADFRGTASTLRQRSVWHLLDSFHLVSLRGKLGTRYHPISSSMPMAPSLTLPASKTDPFRNGTLTHLSQSTSILCPVRALSTLFQVHPKQPDDPLFSRAFGPIQSVIPCRQNQRTFAPSRHQFNKLLWAFTPKRGNSLSSSTRTLGRGNQVTWKVKEWRSRHLH